MATMNSGNICVIPARGGSKRLPKKNIADLFGKPLIAYTIEAAVGSGLFGEHIYVSSDSREILAAVDRYPSVKNVVRPASISGDEAAIEDSCLHILDQLAGETFEFLCMLQPNCPLRTDEDIRQSHQRIITSGADCVQSVVAQHWFHVFWSLREADGRLKPNFEEYITDIHATQLPTSVYFPNGALRWVRVAAFRKEQKYYRLNPVKYVVPLERSVDIDTAEDLETAKKFYPLVFPRR